MTITSPPDKRVINKTYFDEDDEKVICCIPFSSGKYKDEVFEAHEKIHSNQAVYLFSHEYFGAFAIKKFSYDLLWSTKEIPQALITRIQQCLFCWNKHFGHK